MHPMYKELFIDTDADDLAAEQDRRRRMRRSRRALPTMIVTPASTPVAGQHCHRRSANTRRAPSSKPPAAAQSASRPASRNACWSRRLP
jgi:hypothetical protein